MLKLHSQSLAIYDAAELSPANQTRLAELAKDFDAQVFGFGDDFLNALRPGPAQRIRDAILGAFSIGAKTTLEAR